MPTNDTYNNRRAPYSEGQTFASMAGRGRSGDRSRSKYQENGNRSRTKFADRRRKRGRILIALTAVCAVELVYALLTAPALNVRHTHVEGITNASGLAKNEIETTRRAVALPAGTNWLLAPVGGIRTNLTALPWVRSAVVKRHFPTDLVISVEPRTPAYSLIVPAGQYEVAVDNTPIRPLRREMVNRLTPIVLNSPDAPKPGAVFANTAACTAAQILHITQSESGLRIAKIEIDQSTNIWLNMSTGVRIKFGHCDDLDKKIAMMRRLLSHDRGKRFNEINVSNPDWPAGTLREAANHGAPTEVAAAASRTQMTASIRADTMANVTQRRSH